MSLLTRGLRRLPSPHAWQPSLASRSLATAPRRRERPLRATFYRGGTSKALLLRREDLPPDARDAILLSAMGSPDPNGRCVPA